MPSSACKKNADRKSTRLNSSHTIISYAVFCLKKKATTQGNRLQSAPTPLGTAATHHPRWLGAAAAAPWHGVQDTAVGWGVASVFVFLRAGAPPESPLFPPRPPLPP